MIEDIQHLNQMEELKKRNLEVLKMNVHADINMKINGMMLNVLFEDYLERKGHGVTDVVTPMIDEFLNAIQGAYVRNQSQVQLPPGITQEEMDEIFGDAVSQARAETLNKFNA